MSHPVFLVDLGGGPCPPHHFQWVLWGADSIGGGHFPPSPTLSRREEDPDDVPHGHITSLVGAGGALGVEAFGGALEGVWGGSWGGSVGFGGLLGGVWGGSLDGPGGVWGGLGGCLGGT